MSPSFTLNNCQTLAIISPHLDDAVFSCFDHLRDLSSNGVSVTVINCFSRCRNDNIVSPLIAPFMQAVGCHTSTDYEKMRKLEDVKALEILGIKTLDLDFIDAAFRGSNGIPDYTDVSELRRLYSQQEITGLVDALADALEKFSAFDAVLIPMAVGNHIDHVVSRAAAETCWGIGRRGYYADIPYALRPWKWRCDDVRLALSSSPSIKWTSPQKLEAMRYYETQLPFVLPRTTHFPELLFYGL